MIFSDLNAVTGLLLLRRWLKMRDVHVPAAFPILGCICAHRLAFTSVEMYFLCRASVEASSGVGLSVSIYPELRFVTSFDKQHHQLLQNVLG